MSRITSKNLYYDRKPPPFLARLIDSHALSDNHHENNSIRPKKLRTADELTEDEPMYFDQETRHTWTKTEWETKHADEEATPLKQCEISKPELPQSPKIPTNEARNISVNGAKKKRKSGRLIDTEKDTVQLASSSTLSSAGTAGRIDDIKSSISKIGGKKGNGSSTKKIKLSFAD